MTRSSVASKRVVTRRLNRLVIDHGKVVAARANKHIISLALIINQLECSIGYYRVDCYTADAPTERRADLTSGGKKLLTPNLLNDRIHGVGLLVSLERDPKRGALVEMEIW